jgi:hypothetical protein
MSADSMCIVHRCPKSSICEPAGVLLIQTECGCIGNDSGLGTVVTTGLLPPITYSINVMSKSNQTETGVEWRWSGAWSDRIGRSTGRRDSKPVSRLIAHLFYMSMLSSVGDHGPHCGKRSPSKPCNKNFDKSASKKKGIHSNAQKKTIHASLLDRYTTSPPSPPLHRQLIYFFALGCCS